MTQNIFDLKFFWPKIYFGPKNFRSKIYWGPNSFEPKIISGQIYWRPIFFWTQCFSWIDFLTQFFPPRFFGTIIFFETTFWNPNFHPIALKNLISLVVSLAQRSTCISECGTPSLARFSTQWVWVCLHSRPTEESSKLHWTPPMMVWT